MKILSSVKIAVFCLVWTATGAYGQTRPGVAGRGDFTLKSFGEGGGYAHPSPEASNAMEAGTWQQAGKLSGGLGSLGGVPYPLERPTLKLRAEASAPAGLAAQSPPVQIPPLHPALAHARPIKPPLPVPKRAPDSAADDPSRPDADRRRYSLWEGLAAPLELPSHKVKEVGLDEATALGRRDYDSHILSQSEASLTAGGASLPNGGSDTGAGGEIFVAVNLVIKDGAQASFKDAVADLGRTAGFRQDRRFEPAVVGPGLEEVAVWGWMPSRRLGEAMRVPSLARLEIKTSARRETMPATTTRVLLGMRIPSGAATAELPARLGRELGASSGFKVLREIGTQTAPGSGEAVLVLEAELPIPMLSRIMARGDVLKIVPAPQPGAASEAPSDSSPSAQIVGFLSYVRDHAPLLVALTLLALLPAVSAGLLSAARVFIPYR
ncbi:MAG TPA: hypothetical protein DEB40_01860 [Elusimicrobia bacterium]|nr:hypothetical protein [Elusimicrobiota bacterium]HBT60475.1 hypothetical protein [Elusimicrobiota bacterium]